MKILRTNKLPHFLPMLTLQVAILLFLLLPLELQAWPISFFRGSRIGYTRQINPEECTVRTTGETGICMFAFYCMKMKGRHLGPCVDRYLVGSCCKLESNTSHIVTPIPDVDNEISETDIVPVSPLDLSGILTITEASNGQKPEDSAIEKESQTAPGIPHPSSSSNSSTSSSATPGTLISSTSSTLETNGTFGTVESNASDSSTDYSNLPGFNISGDLKYPDIIESSTMNETVSHTGVSQTSDQDTLSLSSGNDTFQSGSGLNSGGGAAESNITLSDVEQAILFPIKENEEAMLGSSYPSIPGTQNETISEELPDFAPHPQHTTDDSAEQLDQQQTKPLQTEHLQLDHQMDLDKPLTEQSDQILHEFEQQDHIQSKPEQPDYLQPESQQPDHLQPESQQPDHLQPDHLQPESQQPDHLQPESQKPDHLQPESQQPDHLQPESQQPDHLQPEPQKPDHLQPESQQPKPQQPEPQQPKPQQPEPQQPEPQQPEPQQPEPQQPEPQQPEPQQPQPQQPESQKPDHLQPESQQPDHLQPESQQPDHLQPESQQPDHLQPESQQPDHLKPESQQPDHLKPESQKPDHLKPESQKPELQKPDHLQPDHLQPDHLQPDHLQPDRIHTDSQQPESALPDQHQPGHMQSPLPQLEHMQPESLDPDNIQSKPEQPEHMQPHPEQLDNLENELQQPDHLQPGTEPEPQDPDHLQPELQQPSYIPTNPQQPDYIPTEPQQPDYTQSHPLQPENVQSDLLKPDHMQPHPEQADHMRPDPQQPDYAQPEPEKIDPLHPDQQNIAPQQPDKPLTEDLEHDHQQHSHHQPIDQQQPDQQQPGQGVLQYPLASTFTPLLVVSPELPQTENPLAHISLSGNEIDNAEDGVIRDVATTDAPPTADIFQPNNLTEAISNISPISDEVGHTIAEGASSNDSFDTPQVETVERITQQPNFSLNSSQDGMEKPGSLSPHDVSVGEPGADGDLIEVTTQMDATNGSHEAGEPVDRPTAVQETLEADPSLSEIEEPSVFETTPIPPSTQVSEGTEDGHEITMTATPSLEVTSPETTTLPNSWNEVLITINNDTTTPTMSNTASTTEQPLTSELPFVIPDIEGQSNFTTTPQPLSAAEQEKKLLQMLKTSTYKEICGKPVYPSSRVVGGNEASYGEWPWQVSFRQWRSVAFLHKCGAAIVNENWAITAAHCVESIEPDQLLLVMGEYDLGRTTEPFGHVERRVQVIAMHPKFEPRTFEYDLALLRFAEPVIFQPNIIPICIPDDDYNYLNETGYVTGWGRLYEDGPLPTVMQKVPVPVIPNESCEEMYKEAGYIEHIPNIFICAGYQNGKQDSCEGDSGGPMVIYHENRWQLAGIISWGIGCAVPNQPGVYTRISEFRDWINKIIIF